MLYLAVRLQHAVRNVCALCLRRGLQRQSGALRAARALQAISDRFVGAVVASQRGADEQQVRVGGALGGDCLAGGAASELVRLDAVAVDLLGLAFRPLRRTIGCVCVLQKSLRDSWRVLDFLGGSWRASSSVTRASLRLLAGLSWFSGGLGRLVRHRAALMRFDVAAFDLIYSTSASCASGASIAVCCVSVDFSSREVQRGLAEIAAGVGIQLETVRFHFLRVARGDCVDREQGGLCGDRGNCVERPRVCDPRGVALHGALAGGIPGACFSQAISRRLRASVGRCSSRVRVLLFEYKTFFQNEQLCFRVLASTSWISISCTFSARGAAVRRRTQAVESVLWAAARIGHPARRMDLMKAGRSSLRLLLAHSDCQG